MMTLKGKSVILGVLLATGLGGAAAAQTATTAPAPVVTPGSEAPGPYAGWPVLSKEGLPVGRVTYSPAAVDGSLPFVVVAGEDGSSFKVTNGIAMIGPDSITLNIAKSIIDASATDNFRNIIVQ